MNLELVEQECFLYLTQCQNPLVPFDSLLAHLRQNAEFAEVTSAELLEFFRDHALFKIVEPSVEPAAPLSSELADAGISTAPRVILKSRIPTPAQLQAQMQEELGALTRALTAALDEAQRNGHEQDAARARALLARAEAFRAELGRVDELGPGV